MNLGNPQLFSQASRPTALRPAAPPAMQRNMSQELQHRRAVVAAHCGMLTCGYGEQQVPAA